MKLESALRGSAFDHSFLHLKSQLDCLSRQPFCSKAFVVCMEFWLGLAVRYRLPRRKRVESPSLELVRNLLLGGPLRLDHLVFPFSPSSTRRRMASNGRPHRLEPRRSESDCRMLLFTSTLDPTMMKQPAQHQFTRRNGQVSDDLPIVDA